MLRNLARPVVRAMLRPIGLDIVHAADRVEPERRLHHLRELGFAPALVLDIGVADGTPWLYAAFPDAEVWLFEPSREAVPHLERLENALHARSFRVALSDHDGEATFIARPSDIAGSSLFEDVSPVEGREYLVPLRRFDGLVSSDALTRPAFCKIDVQGAEMLVLRGMGDRLRQMDAVLIEVSTIATTVGGPELAEVHAFLHEAGFAVYDVLGLNRRPLDGALAQIDLLYVQADHPLRQNRRWR